MNELFFEIVFVDRYFDSALFHRAKNKQFRVVVF